MADVVKFTDAAIENMLLKHADRELKNDSNEDIIESRSHLNYTIQSEHPGMTELEYYKVLKATSYMYGRGTSREDSAITCFGWCFTLPREVSDYTSIKGKDIEYIDYEKEKLFFEKCKEFCETRYPGNFLRATIHYDEAGQPHMHCSMLARKEIDHDAIHFKTLKRNEKNWAEAKKTESGRYEFPVRYQLDKNGERIPVNNYAKVSDEYDYKFSAKEILNRAEMSHFHTDLRDYLIREKVPGAEFVKNGKTAGGNLSISTIKELKKNYGITLDQFHELVKMDPEYVRHIAASLELKDKQISELKNVIEIQEKKIASLTHELEISKAKIEPDISHELEPENSRWNRPDNNDIGYSYYDDSSTSTSSRTGGRW